MTKYFKQIINGIEVDTPYTKLVNGIQYDLNDKEIEQIEQDAIQDQADRLARLAKEEQEKARKESAIAKLKALGLTEEEVKSIL